MHRNRRSAIATAAQGETFGLILGTLGRQGSPTVFGNVIEKLQSAGKKYILVLLSEIYPGKLDLFKSVDAWVQVACPRLSIDWGINFTKPLLSPYELSVALKATEWKTRYPMDFYSYKSVGNWTVNHETNRPVRTKPRRKHITVSVEKDKQPS